MKYLLITGLLLMLLIKCSDCVDVQNIDFNGINVSEVKKVMEEQPYPMFYDIDSMDWSEFRILMGIESDFKIPSDHCDSEVTYNQVISKIEIYLATGDSISGQSHLFKAKTFNGGSYDHCFKCEYYELTQAIDEINEKASSDKQAYLFRLSSPIDTSGFYRFAVRVDLEDTFYVDTTDYVYLRL